MRYSRIWILVIVLPMVLALYLPTTFTQDNLDDVVIAFTDEFLNIGDLDSIDDFYAPDAIHHNPMGELTVELRKQVRAALGMAMPDFQVDIENLSVDGNWVWVRYTFTGTFTGELPTPDGMIVLGNDAPIEMTILDLYHFNEDGRVIESWETFDSLTLAATMGLLPMPESEN
ncbi:MAG: hypothetical protein CUN55_09470 [Phototrophicales bacterium]|nr:MAG: hypothetical protein CUN55_09470 [Phototrophicales bacterium]